MQLLLSAVAASQIRIKSSKDKTYFIAKNGLS
jgi:hypothetical protein